MKHALQISVRKKSKNGGIAAVLNVSGREKFLPFLFGDKTKLTIIVHDDFVEEPPHILYYASRSDVIQSIYYKK